MKVYLSSSPSTSLTCAPVEAKGLGRCPGDWAECGLGTAGWVTAPGAFPLRVLIMNQVAISRGFLSIFLLHHNDHNNILGETCYQKASASCS